MNIKDLEFYKKHKNVFDYLTQEYEKLPTNNNIILLTQKEKVLITDLLALCLQYEKLIKVDVENSNLFNRIMQLNNNSITSEEKYYKIGCKFLDSELSFKEIIHGETTDIKEAFKIYERLEIGKDLEEKYIYAITPQKRYLVKSEAQWQPKTNEKLKTLKEAVFIYETAKSVIQLCEKQDYNIKGIMEQLTNLGFYCYNFTDFMDYQFFDFDFNDIVLLTYNTNNGLETQVQININGNYEDFDIQDIKNITNNELGGKNE